MAKFCPQKGKQTSAFASDHGFLSKVEQETSYLQGNTSKNLEDRWCIDSGSSSHMTHKKENFIELRLNETRRINLASNNSATRASGVGNALMTHKNGQKKITLFNTLFIPDLRTNLLSVGKATDSGLQVLFKKDEAVIMDENGSAILFADRIDGLYYVRQEEPSEEARVTSVESKLMKWHIKFGHLNFRDLRRIISSKQVIGVGLTLRNLYRLVKPA